MRRVVVIGGGIAGLTTALHLKDQAAQVPGGLAVQVLEAGDRVGGNIETHRVEGCLIEGGPNGFLDSAPATLALVDRLGLRGQLQRAEARAARRYLYRNGRLHRLPSGPPGFLTSPLLSWGGRLRVLREPFVRSKKDAGDETIADFGTRRLGPEATAVLLDAMVSGIFAGDIRHLSLASTFPQVAEMEAAHGSLVKAMWAKARARRRAAAASGGPRGTLTSFHDGLATLPKALAAALGEAVQTRQRVTGLTPPDASSAGRWLVHRAGAAPLPADAVVLAIPATASHPLLQALDASLGRAVGAIPTAGLAVVALAYDACAMGGAPDGFGFLAPRGEGLRLLGCLWDSSIFPGRAPEGQVLLRVMIGGAHDPEAVALDEAVLVDTARRELATAMHLTAAPRFAQTYRYPLGIAQYTVGHQARLDQIHQRLAAWPGLWVAGSAFYGVSMNACIENAGAQVQAVLASLA